MAYIYPAKSNQYRAYYLYKSKKIYIGLYNNYEEALLSYNFIDELFRSSLSIDAFKETLPISFEKFIRCLNFRDSNIYIKTPIYIYKDHFKYYFSPDFYLIFDLRDLVYFSTNKIHKRGEYLYTYIGDHQESILKHFGFTKKMTYQTDYQFVNGNRYDFRRTNMKVTNHYTGVFYEMKYNKPTFVTRIFTDKYLVVGHYETEIQAAIAYNKAIDLLSNKPFAHKYHKNTIPFLTHLEYEQIYENIPISKRLVHSSSQNRVCSPKKYRGVAKDQSSYRALIGYQKKRIYLGNYPTEKRAAQAYNFASLYLYGPNGYTNDISPLVYSNDAGVIAQKLSRAGVLKNNKAPKA